MKKVKVFQFRGYDAAKNEIVIGLSLRTKESIEWIRCELIPGTGKLVAEIDVDEGRYVPARRQGMNASSITPHQSKAPA
jgi:hypothetical protein